MGSDWINCYLVRGTLVASSSCFPCGKNLGTSWFTGPKRPEEDYHSIDSSYVCHVPKECSILQTWHGWMVYTGIRGTSLTRRNVSTFSQFRYCCWCCGHEPMRSLCGTVVRYVYLLTKSTKWNVPLSLIIVKLWVHFTSLEITSFRFSLMGLLICITWTGNV